MEETTSKESNGQSNSIQQLSDKCRKDFLVAFITHYYAQTKDVMELYDVQKDVYSLLRTCHGFYDFVHPINPACEHKIDELELYSNREQQLRQRKDDLSAQIATGIKLGVDIAKALLGEEDKEECIIS
jgi:hypothetical protein